MNMYQDIVNAFSERSGSSLSVFEGRLLVSTRDGAEAVSELLEAFTDDKYEVIYHDADLGGAVEIQEKYEVRAVGCDDSFVERDFDYIEDAELSDGTHLFGVYVCDEHRAEYEDKADSVRSLDDRSIEDTQCYAVCCHRKATHFLDFGSWKRRGR